MDEMNDLDIKIQLDCYHPMSQVFNKIFNDLDWPTYFITRINTKGNNFEFARTLKFQIEDFIK